ncbi:DUF3995 domain-containing protein [Sulfurimonas sp.]|uniref:DUF3995 domain-containing protein n=1 Tax=Sulfurimonas sp. TaxID=2022749 RepID=UPI003D13FE2F
MNFIVFITITLLTLIGILHLYWVFGGKRGLSKALPLKNGKLLFQPDKVLTLIVTGVMFFFSYIAYALAFYDFNAVEKKEFYIYSGVAIAIIFLLRAIGEFHVIGFFKKVRDTEFAVYDTKYFSPICVFFGIVFTILTFKASL